MLVEGVKDHAIFMLDPAGRVVTWNAGAERVKGYAAQEIVGQHFAVVPARGRGRRQAGSRAGHRHRTGAVHGRGLSRAQGRLALLAAVTITAIRGEAGELRRFAKLVRDITDRRRAEDSLREGEERRKLAEAVHAGRERFNHVLNMLPAYVVQLSPDYHVPFANRFFEDRFGK